MFHFAKNDKEKEIGLIKRIVSDIKNGCLVVVCIQDTVLTPYKTGQESENRFVTVKLGKYVKSKKIIHA
jgi:hypothetical protein